MSKPRPPFAKITRLTPEGATLSRSGGQPIAVGAEVADGEAVVLATPGGVPGAVTLDRRGVAIAIKTVALPSVGGGLSAVNPFSSAATEVAPSPRPTNMGIAPPVEVVALPADPRPSAPPAQPVLAVPARLGMSSPVAEAVAVASTRQPAPAVKPVATTPASVEGPAAPAAKPSNS